MEALEPADAHLEVTQDRHLSFAIALYILSIRITIL